MIVDRASLLIHWLQVLNNGRVRPDDPTVKDRKSSTSLREISTPCCNETGVVRDSYEFRDYINAINEELKEILL